MDELERLQLFHASAMERLGGEIDDLRAENERLHVARRQYLAEPTAAELSMLAGNRRLTLALRILAGLPDDAGHTYSAELHGVGEMVLYARGVLADAEPGDVAGAIAKGEERDAS
jgi:hypothetical protein